MRGTDPSALLPILDQLLAEIEPDTDELYVAHLHRLRAETLRDRGEYDRAREDAAEFETVARRLNDPLLMSRSLMLHGTIDAEQNNIANALDRFHEARRLLEAVDEPGELSRVNTAIGVAHNFALDFVRARRYYEEALRLARLAGDPALETSALGNLALAVSEIEGPEVGLPMHHEALALAEKRGDLHGVALQNGSHLRAADATGASDRGTRDLSRSSRSGHRTAAVPTACRASDDARRHQPRRGEAE